AHDAPPIVAAHPDGRPRRAPRESPRNVAAPHGGVPVPVDRGGYVPRVRVVGAHPSWRRARPRAGSSVHGMDAGDRAARDLGTMVGWRADLSHGATLRLHARCLPLPPRRPLL